MVEASFYISLDDQLVKCELCPHHCRIKPGQVGICRVRKNIDGKLYSMNYGVVSAAALDPIEKKPLFDFHPGSHIFSIGSVGCNLGCVFCQNWQIATATEAAVQQSDKNIPPEAILDAAIKLIPNGNIGVAYTYNEPTVWFEYMRDIAALVKENNLKNVMVSNGFIEVKPLEVLLGLIDAFNIDLKGYSNDFYKRMTKSELDPVLRTLEMIAKNGNHLEIAYLVIPGENDDPTKFREIVGWLKGHVGEKVTLHIDRYFPNYKLQTPPTSVESLHELADIAKSILPRVHIGNV